MKKIIALALAALLLTAGCTPGGKVTSLTEDVEPSSEEATAAEPCSDYDPAVTFGLSLFSKAAENGDENPVLSPLSAYLCLAMVQNGAGSDTLKEFEQVLGADTDGVNSISRALIQSLTSTEGDTKLSIADSAWADDDHAQIREDYLQTITDNFGADVFTADLPSDAALQAINAWVNEKTNGLIPTLHEQNYPDSTVLVLLSTIYLKAKWQNEFLGSDTYDGDFTPAGGAAVSVPFLHAQESRRDYINADGAEGILLPYNDGKTAFIALRPTDGSDIRAFISSLTAERLAAYIGSASETLVNFSMPKYTIEYSLYLNDILKEMGLNLVFDSGSADLSGMGTGVNGPLYLSWVFQKVKIEVNEEGTEAAAVTEAAMTESAMMPTEPPAELHLDSPFFYAVVDLSSGVPLFMGVLDDPS